MPGLGSGLCCIYALGEGEQPGAVCTSRAGMICCSAGGGNGWHWYKQPSSESLYAKAQVCERLCELLLKGLGLLCASQFPDV